MEPETATPTITPADLDGLRAASREGRPVLPGGLGHTQYDGQAMHAALVAAGADAAEADDLLARAAHAAPERELVGTPEAQAFFAKIDAKVSELHTLMADAPKGKADGGHEYQQVFFVGFLGLTDDDHMNCRTSLALNGGQLCNVIDHLLEHLTPRQRRLIAMKLVHTTMSENANSDTAPAN
jgi:hypothetical protein